ncbi:MAG: transglycosylase domain-containing protein [Bacteroidetes bacterium]|nr:transglycosylase domain-containing protein [Bacteroidota bacterium]
MIDGVKIKKISIYAAGIVASLLLVSLLLRNVIFSFYMERKISRFNNEYHAILLIDKAGIRNFSSILLTGISLKPENGDTLLSIDSARASLSFWKMIVGRVALQDLELGKVRISVRQADTTTNYMFLLRGRKTLHTEDTLEHPNYASFFSRLSSAVFEQIPSSVTIRELIFSYEKERHRVVFDIPGFKTEHHAFHTDVTVTENDSVHHWVLAGSLDNYAHGTGFRLYSATSEKIKVPFIGFAYKASASFDTLTFQLSEEAREDDLFHGKGMTILRGLVVHQEKIASSDVAFDRLGMEFAVNIGSDYFEMDSSSQVFFNRLSFHPYMRYRPDPSKQITFSIHKPDFPAEELFSSLPEGLFSTMKGMKVTGNLGFSLDFFVDLSLPDSLRFMADVKRKRFGVVSYGNADLTRMNGPFEYTAYEGGQPARTFAVGPGNPDFRQLNKISPFLQISVLNSEDPGFFLHRGFIGEAFRESIIQNIKERKFARGGSTITMQLVKNVFLNRNKNIARKLEEILLVWLIENQELCPKERMFEVYLNIIELGPHVYGANEAARYYFRKDASKLTLQESIFLASIIPKPRWFFYSFDETGHLNPSTKAFYSLLSGKMLKKGQISQDEYEKLVPDVTLTGPAKLLLKSEKLVPADSLESIGD